MAEIKQKTRWERIKARFARFFSDELASGIMMLIAVVVALIIANTQWSHAYHEFWEFPIRLTLNTYEVELTVHQLVNDGLMAIFFFSIGLEIKREIMAGELSNLKKAMLPIVCALGGLAVPALIYYFLNMGGDTVSGWGIPMATDIVFALVLLTVVGGKKVPIPLKIFVTALAVVDDLCAVLVIAFFYTDQIVVESLIWAFASFTLLLGANLIGVKNPVFYGIVGILGIWTGFFFSGVHATIAGVITATAIPAKVDFEEAQFIKRIRTLISSFEKVDYTDSVFVKNNQLEVVRVIRNATTKAVPPLQAIEKALQPFVDFIVLPLFALANTGLTIKMENIKLLVEPLSLGIILGLVLGKVFGITLAAKVAIWTKIARLPEGVRWPQIFGAAAFAGIGFTMSIFISELAFDKEDYVYQSKLAILVAFAISVAIGLTIFRFFVEATPESSDVENTESQSTNSENRDSKNSTSQASGSD